MSSLTTDIATQYRLQEWAAQIRDCQNRPDGVSVVQWCSQNGITKANYYYRLRRVREACIENIPEQMLPQPVVPVSAELLSTRQSTGTEERQELDITTKGFSIHVTDTTSMDLLAMVLEVLRNVE